MKTKQAHIKRIIIVIACLILLTFATQAQTSFEDIVKRPKVLPPITNTGPVDPGRAIMFTGTCTADDTRLIICKNNAICNTKTQPQDLLCTSLSSNASEKSCLYTPSQFDEGLHDNDIATCCNVAGECDTTSIKIENWIVSPSPQQLLTVIDENSQPIPTIINVRDNKVDISFTNQPITKVTFTNLKGTTLGLSTTARGIVEPANVQFIKTYALDIDTLNFTEATLFATASSSALYRCDFWDFTFGLCLGSWEFVQPITEGTDYSVKIDKGTFGFAEGYSTAPLPINRTKAIVQAPITNSGSVAVGTPIAFTGTCTGENTRMIICRENTICNTKTQPQNLFCTSAFSNISEKSCTYIPSSFDEEVHQNDIATCCNAAGDCDTATVLLEPWIVTKGPVVARPLLKEEIEGIIQEQAEINKPVKWIKKIRLNEISSNVSVTLDKDIEDIRVLRIIEGSKQEMPVTKWSMKKTNRETELSIHESVQDADIEYVTEAPAIVEEPINKYRKKVTISSNIHYTNILTYTSVPETTQERIKIYWLANESRYVVNGVNYVDTNNNGFIDKVEWMIPSLSNQTYIIEITKAEHLDENRNFISDIYEQVKELDGIWSETIAENEYVRVVFEKNLTNNRDITLYPRVISGAPRIIVYEVNGTNMIAEFVSLTNNQYNSVLLTNLQESQDTFDLLIVDGTIEIDHIIDPQISLTLRPNGDTLTGWTATNCTEDVDEYRCVNETTLVTSDYISTATNKVRDRFDFTTEGGHTETIDAAEVCVHANMESGSDNLVLEVRDDTVGGIGSSTTFSVSTTGAYFCYNFTTNPNGGAAWTWPDIDDIQAGVQYVKSGQVTTMRVNQVYLTVHYQQAVDDLPTFYNITTTPPNASAYSPSQLHEFNITWTDDGQIDEVIITFNNTNFTSRLDEVYNLSTVFSFNITGLAAAKYNYTWHANDTSGNSNKTVAQEYTVTKAPGNTTLKLDGNSQNLTITANDGSVNITADRGNGESNMELFRDGAALSTVGDPTASITNISFFTGVGDFNITSFAPSTENFTDNFTTFYVLGRDNQTPIVNLSSPPDDNVTETGNVTFESNATDNIQLYNATLYHNITGTWEANETAFLNGTFNETSFTINSIFDTIFIWNVEYCDNASNCAFAVQNFTVNSTLPVEAAAPVVGAIYVFSTQAVTIPDQTVTEDDAGGPTSLEVAFNITNTDVNDIDLDTANLTIIRSLGPGGNNNQSFNTSCVNFANTSTTEAAFRCSIEIHYWYEATNWNITVGIVDFAANAVTNTSNFSISSTTAIVISPVSITFPTLTIGTENITANQATTVNNTANAQFLGTATSSVNITGTSLVGATTPAQYIDPGNFTVDIDTGGSPPAECTAATALVNATTTRIVNSVLLAGNRSAGFGNETLYNCLTIVPSGLSPQDYTTNSSAAWTVSV